VGPHENPRRIKTSNPVINDREDDEEIGARLPGGRLDYMPTPIPDNGKVRRFGLDLDQEAFDRLGEALDRVTEAERAAWRDNR
jgi:hypothetical protein